MSLVDGDERAVIPSMSWSSVVGDESVDVESGSGDDTAADPGPPATANVLVDTPVLFQMTSLIDDETAAPEPASAPESGSAPEPVATPAPPPPPISVAMGAPDATAEQPRLTARHAAVESDTTVSAVRPEAPASSS